MLKIYVLAGASQVTRHDAQEGQAVEQNGG
jgi:hypothetical protein